MDLDELRALLTGLAGSDPARTTPHPVLLVFAHPDDESVALGARLGSFASSHLVHVTDGTPRNGEDSRAHGFSTLDAYREARQAELRCALEAAGAPALSHESLGIPDQEASLHLVSLTRRLRDLLRDYEPAVVMTHPYEGGHPDHDACAFAVHHAVASLPGPAPVVVEAAFYHQGPNGIETGCFLLSAGSGEQALYRLSSKEIERKRAVFACFTTQGKTLQYFPLEHEVFRCAPAYDFTRPPHAGTSFYDGFPWGMTSRRFCELTAAARQELNA